MIKINPRYFEFLAKYLSFQSVSTSDKFTKEINDCVNWLDDQLTAEGFQVNVISGYANPIIIAKLNVGAAETCLVYGHYDVQPADEHPELWFQNPFELLVKNDRIYGRGVADNKGQFTIHLLNIIEAAKAKKLAYNITIMLEGNEESGSPLIDKFIEDYQKELACDFAIISDGEMIDNHPTIEAGLRGIAVFTVQVTTSSKELHSGTFGGFVHNAASEISKLISQIEQNGEIAIPGFYEGAREFYQQNKKLTETYILDDLKLAKLTGSNKFKSNLGYHAQTGLLPAIEIIGLKSGFIASGYKTAIPNEAEVKINIRTVGRQNTAAIVAQTVEFFKENLIPGLEISFQDHQVKKMADPVVLDLANEYVSTAKKILEHVYQEQVIYNFVGGSIPLVGELQRKITRNLLMLPLTNYDCDMHSINENFDLAVLEKSLRISNLFFSKK
ncbi:MAG: M20/M25/M40 family metallo-hydrolase [bacterium]